MWYSLEAAQRAASNGYQQHMFLWTNEKNICDFQLKKKSQSGNTGYSSYLELSVLYFKPASVAELDASDL